MCGLALFIFKWRFEISIRSKVSLFFSYEFCSFCIRYLWFLKFIREIGHVGSHLYRIWMGWNEKEDRDKKMFTFVELEMVFDFVIWLHYTGNIIKSFSISGPRILRVLERE